ncbi:MAG: hypothetical protein GXO54_00810 [Chloroflexi bacterium]|nr:hypothetical protein [Chloroflexota bacterium]
MGHTLLRTFTTALIIADARVAATDVLAGRTPLLQGLRHARVQAKLVEAHAAGG